MINRRRFLETAGAAVLVPLLPATPRPLHAAELSGPETGFSFSPAEEARLRGAADRIIPPFDNQAISPQGGGISFAGAGQEGAFEYVLGLLTAFDVPVPRIYPAGRTDPSDSDSAFGRFIGSSADLTECDGGHQTVAENVWLPLPPEKELAWRAAVARMQQAYRNGLALLESDATTVFGRSFVDLPGAAQTALLQAWDGANHGSRIFLVYASGGGEAALRSVYSGPADPRGSFFNMLHTHVMEAIYGDPAYGGNRERIGWKLAGFGGPRHPEGYSTGELESPASCDHGTPVNLKLPENLS